MFELHGFASSNYYNIAKVALLEKGIDFKEVKTYAPSQTAPQASPMDKVPFLVTERGPLAESQVILDYLEEVCPEPALYPKDAYERAKVRELMRIMELYIELSGRSLFAEAFFGATLSEPVKQAAKDTATKAIDALKQLTSFDPFIAGASMTYADISAFVGLSPACLALKQVVDLDVIAAVPGFAGLIDKLSERETFQRTIADREANFPEFIKLVQTRLGLQ